MNTPPDLYKYSNADYYHNEVISAISSLYKEMKVLIATSQATKRNPSSFILSCSGQTI